METYFIKEDVRLACIIATSFPDGITTAHEKLHQLLPQNDRRKFFGISYSGKNGIVYKVGVEEAFHGEGDQLKLDSYVVKKGEYVGARIINYTDHLESIGKTFEKLLTNPRLDPNGCCIEMYLNEKDVQCMVRLESKSPR